MTKTKYYTSNDIRDQFDNLSKDETIDVLSGAIDYMQSYNGRSKLLCIAMAMGYENQEGGTCTYTKKYEVNILKQ